MLERLRKLHFSWIYFFSILGTVSYFFLLNNTAHPDLWGRMAIGALYEYNDYQFPYKDVFTYTAVNLPVYDHEWGASMFYYWLVKTMGSGSLLLLQIVLYAVTLYLPIKLALKALSDKKESLEQGQSKAFLFALFFIPLALLMSALYLMTLWTHDFTFLFYALFLSVLEYCRSTKRYAWLFILPVLSFLWVNIHGGFIVGFCVIGIYFLASVFKALKTEEADKKWELPKRFALILFLCGIAILINPYGVDYLRHIWTFWFLDRSSVADWDSVFSNGLPPFQPFYGLFYGLSFAFWLALAFFDWKKQGFKTFPWRLLLIGATGYEGMIHYKLVPLFVVTVLSLGFQLQVPKRPQFALPEAFKKRFHAIVYYLLPLSLLISSLYMCVKYVVSHPNPIAVKVSDSRGMGYPISAVNYLKRNKVQGKIWSTFIWGEFLYWNLYPDMKVAMDGRFETLYPMAFYKEFRRFVTAPYDLDIPLKYGTTHLLVPNDKVNNAFFEAIKKSQVWHELYRDPNAIIYSVKKLEPGQLVEENTEPAPLMTVDDYFVKLQSFRLEN